MRVRDYKRENILKSKPGHISARVIWNRNRRRAIASGRARVGDGTVIHHDDGNIDNNSKKNLRKMNKRKHDRQPKVHRLRP